MQLDIDPNEQAWAERPHWDEENLNMKAQEEPDSKANPFSSGWRQIVYSIQV